MNINYFMNEAIKEAKYAYDKNVSEYDTAPNYGRGYAEYLLGKFY